MKALFIIPILAVTLMAGCTTGSKGKVVNVTEPTAPVATEATAPTAVPVVVVPAETPVTEDGGRIDAASFLDALVKSGCEINKAEYKEVIRGGGIVVTCVNRVDVLDTEGLGDL